MFRALARYASFLLPLSVGCSGVIDPDPYIGTIDPSLFDPMVAFQTSSSSPLAACLSPRRGFGGDSGLDGVTWIYLGGLSATQLDLSNATDTTKALPPAIYQVSGCNAPEGRADLEAFDARLDNYLHNVQYPVLAQGFVPGLAGAASEPTKLSTYKPFHVVVPTTLHDSIVNRMGCNDIKGERSLLERAGWSRDTKAFPDDGPHDFDFHFPSRDELANGKAKFKDWPMVSVAVPIMNTPDAGNCPFTNGSQAVVPRYPGDPSASFQFPTQHWLRGLLGGYLDGGDLPVTTDTTKCPPGLPICPVLNELYVAIDEVPVPTAATAANPIPSATVVLKDPADSTKTRTADILAVFAATPGQPGYSPVCRLHFFDKTKLSCGHTEPDPIAPRPLCTAQQIQASGALVTVMKDYYVHCLFRQPIAAPVSQ